MYIDGHVFSYEYLYVYACKMDIIYCKDQIWREFKTGMDPGPRSPNNEFIECRKES